MRDHRPSTIVTFVIAGLLVSPICAAAERAETGKLATLTPKATATVGANAAVGTQDGELAAGAQPAGNSAPGSTPATTRDQAAPAPSPPAAPGVSVEIAGGASLLRGGDRAGGGFTMFDLMLGVWIRPQFGILAGVRGGPGALSKGCEGDCSSGATYQIPVTAQYALNSRVEGLYFEAGIALFSTYFASTDTSAHPDQQPETLTMSSPVDLKLGVGYRLPILARPGKPATMALDMKVGADVGKFTSVQHDTVDGDPTPTDGATHFALGFSAGFQFGN